MSERISILDEIKKGGYEASLITTFNCYLPFYEDVVLRRLISQGVKHNILMMDEVQCAAAIASYPPRLAGRYYSLIPMKSAGAFHPKVILLIGKNKGALLIGSHNMTLSGFGYNREITNLVMVQSGDDGEALSLIRAVVEKIPKWLAYQGDEIPDHMVEMVKKVWGFAPWLVGGRERTHESWILGSEPHNQSLWEQLKSRIHGQVKRVLTFPQKTGQGVKHLLCSNLTRRCD